MAVEGTSASTARTRAAVLRSGTAGLAAVATLSACGVVGPGSGTGATARPAAPVEIEYWSTLRANQPEGKGRLEALKLSEQANAEYVRVRYEQEGGSDAEKIIAAVSAGTPPDLLVLSRFLGRGGGPARPPGSYYGGRGAIHGGGDGR